MPTTRHLGSTLPFVTESESRQSLGREIKRALSVGSLSVAAAARKMEVEPKRLYRWINGEVSPRLDDIHLLAIAIGQPLSVHFGRETQEDAAPAEPERLGAEEVAEAVVTKLEGRLQSLGDSIATRVAEETSQLVLRSVALTEQDEDNPDQTDGRQHEVGRGG